MPRVATIDPALSVKVISRRELTYDAAAEPDEDRPDHVRAASGIVALPGRLVVVQDDAQFFGVVAADGVSAQVLPRGVGGRRRFEVGLGNKLDKVDLESCVAIDDELWAFGSGSLANREKIVRVVHGVPQVVPSAPLYVRCREALSGALNIEGAARVVAGGRDELWLFHRGNTGPTDPGPAVLRVDLPALRTWLDAKGPVPALVGVERYELGAIAGQRLGFTDAVAAGDRVFYLAAAEDSPNAIDDGATAGSQLGVIEPDGRVRAAPLAAPDGAPLKAEGLAFDRDRPGHGWVVVDPDDPDKPSTLLEIQLVGPW